MKCTSENYAGIDDQFARFDNAGVVLTSIPYDGTSTWGKGADKGFGAFRFASENMELYDIETNSEPYKVGVFMNKPLKVKKLSPEEMVEKVYKHTTELLKSKKFLTFFGGEHSISIGVLRAYAEKHKSMTVLQLDAHTDLRQEYNGTQYNHACAVAEAQRNSNLLQVGIRSMDISEKKYLQKGKVFFAHEIMSNDTWMNQCIKKMTKDVFITLDLDVFDSSLMPSTGTPEPGGMQWYQVLKFLKLVFTKRNVIGFDIVELAPNKHNPAPDFLAAKLYYKMLAYKFYAKK
ncbi:MAG TPA: agmatinase [Saprospiraceae bacterium]|nr:agmatinase [Saprospiraceae bacterium]